MMARLSEQATLYPADSLFQYSNLGLTLAGEIAAKHSGKPYADHVQEAILAPLELWDTRPFFPANLHGKQMAIGYSGKFRNRERQPVPPFDTKAIAPAAGFTSSVSDLAKFASWQFRTLSGERNEVLDPNTLREMHRVHWVNPDWKVTWGIGFVVSERDGTSTVGHSGGCPGYITQFVLVPKHTGQNETQLGGVLFWYCFGSKATWPKWKQDVRWTFFGIALVAKQHGPNGSKM